MRVPLAASATRDLTLLESNSIFLVKHVTKSQVTTMSEPPPDDVDLTGIADKLLKTSYAKHLVREEANRQIKSLIKLWLIPVTLVLGAALTFFGLKANTISKKADALEDRVTDLDKSADQTATRIAQTTTQVQIAGGLVESARKDADQGSADALEGAKTVQASIGLVSSTYDATKKVRDDIETARNDIEALAGQKDKLASDMEMLRNNFTDTSAKEAGLEVRFSNLDGKYSALTQDLNNINPDFKRFRVFRIQVLSTGRSNDVVFGDPEGNGSYKMRVDNLEKSRGSDDHFLADLDIRGPDNKHCAYAHGIMLQFRNPYSLRENLKGHEETRNCLPEGVKLFIDATPYVPSMGRVSDPQKNTPPLAQFVFLRVDTEL